MWQRDYEQARGDGGLRLQPPEVDVGAQAGHTPVGAREGDRRPFDLQHLVRLVGDVQQERAGGHIDEDLGPDVRVFDRLRAAGSCWRTDARIGEVKVVRV